MNKPTQDERLAERKAIVAWLRQCRSSRLRHHREICDFADDDVLDAIISAADTFGDAANAIERGEHIPSSPEGGE